MGVPPPFSIVNLREGVRRDVEAFLVNNDAFPILENAYLFRGRIQRRSCFEKIGITNGKLKREIGTTNPAGPGAGDFSKILPNFPIPSGISVFTVGSTVYTDSGAGIMLTSSGGVGTATLNLLTGQFDILAGPIATSIIYEPGLPVTGLKFKEQNEINDEAYIGFDTRYNYYFSPGVDDWTRQVAYKTTGVEFIWTGQDYDLFWTFNYANAMWTTNNVPGNQALAITSIAAGPNSIITFTGGTVFAVGDVVSITNSSVMGNNGLTGTVTVTGAGTVTTTISGLLAPAGGILHAVTTSISGDGIRWYDGPDSNVTSTVGWVNFNPPLDSSQNPILLRGCLCIVAYKGTLIAFNTYEDTVASAVPINFKQRARWSQIGTPYYVPPVPTNQTSQVEAWLSDTPGRGGFADAPTNEAIVSVEFIKDTLIVYFERSTWQLVFTQNPTFPFVWQKINTELGCESTFSVVPFDRGVFAVGNYGIISCDSVNVSRIDQKIPDEVFQIQNKNEGVKRVYGIRDFTQQLVYFTYPVLSDEDSNAEPVNQNVLYPNRVLVYNYLDGSWAEFDDSFTVFGYFQKQMDRTWGATNIEWGALNEAWNSGFLQARYPDVAAGNQQGYTMIFSQAAYLGKNSPSVLFSSYTQPNVFSPNHNLTTGMYVKIDGVPGLEGLHDGIYQIRFIDVNTFELINAPAVVYSGNGRITVLPNFEIVTKIFSPFFEEGKGVRISKVEILAERTAEGQISIQVLPNYSLTESVVERLMNTKPDAATGFQQVQDKIWHRTYLNVNGGFVQLKLSLNDDQMQEFDQTTANVRISGINLYFQPSGRIF